MTLVVVVVDVIISVFVYVGVHSGIVDELAIEAIIISFDICTLRLVMFLAFQYEYSSFDYEYRLWYLSSIRLQLKIRLIPLIIYRFVTILAVYLELIHHDQFRLSLDRFFLRLS